MPPTILMTDNKSAVQCLACGEQIPLIDNAHLFQCCGLTLQEYSIRHKVPLDVLLPPQALNNEPPAAEYPAWQAPQGRHAVMLAALHAVGGLRRAEPFYVVDGEIRRLDQLLWLAGQLADYGFVFHQTYRFDEGRHRVAAHNALKALCPADDDWAVGDLAMLSRDDFLLWLAMAVAWQSDFYHGYVFLRFKEAGLEPSLSQRLKSEFGIRLKALQPLDQAASYSRTQSGRDAHALLELLKAELLEIPAARQRFYEPQPHACVAREQSFDCAHFITDHPGSCVNLHGGHYRMIVKIKDRIDPYTGFVVDYGYLNRVIRQRVVNLLDHQCLNQVSARLAWRSSTELINEFAWRQMLDYLPNLQEIKTYETPQSYCTFRGPSLDEEGSAPIAAGEHFLDSKLGKHPVRAILLSNNSAQNARQKKGTA